MDSHTLWGVDLSKNVSEATAGEIVKVVLMGLLPGAVLFAVLAL